MNSVPPSSKNGSQRPAEEQPGAAEGPFEPAAGVASTVLTDDQLRGPRSVGSLTLDRYGLDVAVSRRTGPKAQQAELRLRLRRSQEQGDADQESSAAAALARDLGARGVELDVATKLARRALVLRDEPDLRRQLADWFSGLGEPALAAATLRQLADELRGPEAATTLRRVAILSARAGDAQRAVEALEVALQADPDDSQAAELLGSLGSWAAEVVSKDRASEAYLEAASRRDALGERSAAFENLLRAFEMAPESAVAGERLCAALASRGRVGAADEVRRQQARARGSGGRDVHLRRFRELATAGDVPRALGAALDARLDAELDWTKMQQALGLLPPPSGEPSFDSVLQQAGLVELVAARLELMCEMVRDDERAGCLLALGRYCASALGSVERAVDAWIDAFVLDPATEEAKAALREHAASTHDATALLEALIRVAQAPIHTRPEVHAACLRELFVLADQRLADPGLSRWVVGRMEAAGLAAVELENLRERLVTGARQQDEELEGLLGAVASAAGPERGRLLRRIASILSGRPDRADEAVAVLSELVQRFPDERSWRTGLERLCWREARYDDLAALLQETIERRRGQPEATRGVLALAALHRRRGDVRGALGCLLGEQPGVHLALASMALAIAAKLKDDAARAQALLQVVVPLPATVRGVLGAVAAELLLSSGQIDQARAAAQQAGHADPTLARPIAASAAVALVSGRPEEAPALERAMGVIVPRAAMCEALAAAQEASQDLVFAVAWTQRWLTLRPCDGEATIAMLRRCAALGDAARLADALAAVLGQPHPLAPLAPELARVLSELGRLDPKRAKALTRRTLDVVGPRHEPIRAAVLEVARAAGEPALAIAVLERWLAAGARGEDRQALMLDLARRRLEASEPDAAARAWVRVLAEGGSAEAVLAELDRCPPAQSSDGELALLEARAEALSAVAAADFRGAAWAWREYGAACWDLAGDEALAVRAWERAAALDPERGNEKLAADLLAFAGPDGAIEQLCALADRQREPPAQSRLLGLAANVALQVGRRDQALALVRDALARDASQGDLLAVAERAADAERVDQLIDIYDRVADAALGCFGERAARYRAARQLEQRGAPEAAFRNAVAAFEAVPAAGVTFVLAARLADRTGSTMDFVRAIERVAAAAKHDGERAAWLERAASSTGSTGEGKRERVEVLLRALSLRPDVETLRTLGQAIGDLIEWNPEDTEIVELRFEKAVSSMLAHLDGPDGARAAIEAAHAALASFDSAPLGAHALEQALRCCADLEEYARLLDFTDRLGNAPEQARAILSLMQELSSARYAAVSREMVDLGVKLANEFDDARSAASLLVHAALRDSDDAELARQAAAAAEASGDPDLLAMIVDLVPKAQRTASLVALAAAAEQVDDHAAAQSAWVQVLASPDVDPAARQDAFERLRELYASAGQRGELARLLVAEFERDAPRFAERSELVAELTGVAAALGDDVRLLRVALALAAERGDDEAVWQLVAAAAQRTGDTDARTRALARLAELSPEHDARLGLRRQLASELEQAGRHGEAVQAYRELLEEAPHDGLALLGLERDAERRQDHDGLLELLGRRASATVDVAEERALRLRRAELLEQQLGRHDDATAELESLLGRGGEDGAVLAQLADLQQRLGRDLRAASLWLRAGQATNDPHAAALMAQKACTAYLGGGDVASARRVLTELGQAARSREWLELAVEVERRSEDPAALAAALARLASHADLDEAQQAELLLEAARFLETTGDLEATLKVAGRAAALAPEQAATQLLARRLEYSSRGAGDAAAARTTVAELRGISGPLAPEQEELRAFLIAEALDVAISVDVARRELERVQREIGLLPLIALGLAERTARSSDSAAALPFFEAALRGDLRAVRVPGVVALQAAETAYAADRSQQALEFLEVAGADTSTRADALALAAMIRDDLRSSVPPDGGVREPPPGTLRYPGLVDLVEDAEELDEDELEQLSGPTVPPVLEVAETTEREVIEEWDLIDVSDSSSVEPLEEWDLVEVPAKSIPPGRAVVRPVSVVPDVEEPAPPASASEESEQEPEGGPPSFLPTTRDEGSLLDALARGSVQAGRELLSRLRPDPGRAHDRLRVCNRLAALLPGERDVLDELFVAAEADKNPAYAKAVDHARSAFSADTAAVRPPPLLHHDQSEQLHAMLFRDSQPPAVRALTLVWSGAAHVFQREPADYQVTGLERVSISAPTELGLMYSEAARGLGLGRTPLFQRRQPMSPTFSVARLAPPAVIVAGDVEDTSPVLSFRLAAALASTLPENILLLGSTEEETRGLFEALTLAFGPHQGQGSKVARVARLAEVLWESLSQRAQREMRELCADPRSLDYPSAVATARRAVRRAGLFVCGDLGVAVRETCAAVGIAPEVLAGPSGLATACASSEDISDLVRLATSPEYAEARWTSGRGAGW